LQNKYRDPSLSTTKYPNTRLQSCVSRVGTARSHPSQTIRCWSRYDHPWWRSSIWISTTCCREMVSLQFNGSCYTTCASQKHVHIRNSEIKEQHKHMRTFLIHVPWILLRSCSSGI